MIQYKRSLSIALLLLAGVGGAAAEEAPERTHDIVVDDYFSIAWLSDSVVSPSGRWVAYTERRWDESLDGRNADLWIVDARATDGVFLRKRLTFDDTAEVGQQWSPDERFIYFTMQRTEGDGDKPPANGKTQVWRINIASGVVTPVTREAEGVHGFELSHDGRSIYYVTGRKDVQEGPWAEMRKQHEDIEFGHGEVTYSELWKLDLEAWRSERLVEDDRVIDSFSVAPDEGHIAMVRRPDNTLLSNEGWSTVDLYDTASAMIETLPDEQWREKAPSPYGWIVSPCWSDDGRALAFRVDFDGYPGEIFVARLLPEGIDLRKIARPDEVSAEGQMAWRPGTGDLCFVGDDHARARVYSIAEAAEGLQGRAVQLTPGDVVVETFSFTPDGDQMAIIRGGLDHPGDVYISDAGRPRRTTRLTVANPQVDTWKIPTIELVRWTAPDGIRVEGILELPPGYDRDEPLPMVVEIHGGPTSSTKYHFRYWIYGRTIFAARGWALLSPNYRGSTGYGDTFLTDLIGHENDIEVKDIIAGVDAMIDRGVADPTRLAVMGWSNGGYLTNCIITHDQRFKAASSGAGVFDMALQWGIEDTPGHVINYAEGLPWDVPEEMRRMSPLYDVNKITTPTLIHVGEDDARVPAQNSTALHRALHRYLDVPCELLIYPGEGHGLTTYKHRKAKLTWDVAWFDTYVLGKSSERAE